MKKKIDYNIEPVEFCLACNSLNIKDIGGNALCGKCGVVNFTDKTDINKYLKSTDDGRKKTR